jgi:hypothetical protein
LINNCKDSEYYWNEVTNDMHDNESRLHYIPSFIGRLLHRKLGEFPSQLKFGQSLRTTNNT